jgi:hypothetical protein
MCFQGQRQFQDDGQAGNLVAAFHLSDVRRRQARPLGQVLLRPRMSFPDTTNDFSEDCCLARFRHMWK